MNTPDNVILCGFMGTGKTTVGQLVAARLGWRFADTDQVIEARQGRSVYAIFAGDGEAAFRRLESDLCLELADWHNTVIACGGGIVMKPDNRAALIRAGLVVCLEAPASEIAARLSGAMDRPLLAGDDPVKRISDLLASRKEAYGTLPHHIDTTGCAPEDVAAQIVRLRERQHV